MKVRMLPSSLENSLASLCNLESLGVAHFFDEADSEASGWELEQS